MLYYLNQINAIPFCHGRGLPRASEVVYERVNGGSHHVGRCRRDFSFLRQVSGVCVTAWHCGRARGRSRHCTPGPARAARPGPLPMKEICFLNSSGATLPPRASINPTTLVFLNSLPSQPFNHHLTIQPFHCTCTPQKCATLASSPWSLSVCNDFKRQTKIPPLPFTIRQRHLN